MYCDKTTEVRITRFLLKVAISIISLMGNWSGYLDRGLKIGWDDFRVSVDIYR